MAERPLDYLRALRQRHPGLWASLTESQRQRIVRSAEAASEDGLGFTRWRRTVEELGFVTNWLAAQTAPPSEETPGSETPPPAEEEEEEPGDNAPAPTTPEEQANTDVRDLLIGFLRENQLPESLIGFITDSLAAKKSYAQIIAELRTTPEYKAAYPENEVRQARGLSWMPEAEIRATRDELRRLANEYLGVTDVTQEELTEWIGKGKSVRLWEQKIQRLREFERWGPTVKAVLETELGYSLDDERLYAFFDDTPTPELDHAYERALMRAQPAVLGLGIRPEEEAELLRRYGIAPEQAFRGYQDLARELPRAERLNLIDAEIGRNVDRFPTGTELFSDTPFATVFRAVQLGDADAIRQLQSQMAVEVARWQGQGGAAQNQRGQSIGLLTEEERRAL